MSTYVSVNDDLVLWMIDLSMWGFAIETSLCPYPYEIWLIFCAGNKFKRRTNIYTKYMIFSYLLLEPKDLCKVKWK